MILPIKDKEVAARLAGEAIRNIKCPNLKDVAGLGDYAVVAIIEHGQVAAVVVLYGYCNGNIHGVFDGRSKRWGTRRNMRDLLNFMFEGTPVRRVSSCCPHTDFKAIKANEAGGFVREGTRREAYGPGIHAADFGMTRADARRWIRRAYKRHGQVLRAA